MQYIHFTPCLKNKPNYFCYNYVELPPNLTIFGTMMANCLKLYEVHSFSTLPNSRGSKQKTAHFEESMKLCMD